MSTPIAPADPAPPARRRVVVVDTETDGLDPVLNRCVEVAWLDWRPRGLARPHGDGGAFVPPHELTFADPESLRINGYRERLADVPRDYTYRHTRRLHEALTGAALAGANPRFDAGMLRHLFTDAGLTPEPWHHRLVDVQTYAGGLLGFPPWSIPSLFTLAETVGVPLPTHGAWDDTCAAAAVLDVVCARFGLVAEVHPDALA